MAARVDVALDLPRTRQLSVGMKAYAEELAARLPRVAPDLRFATLERHSALSVEEQIALPLALRRAKAGLVHYLSVYAPVAGPRPYVITIHDQANGRPVLWDGRAAGLRAGSARHNR